MLKTTRHSRTLLILFTIILFSSCSDMINDKYGFKKPGLVNSQDKSEDNDYDDDDFTPDKILDKFDVTFDDQNNRWFSDEEFCVANSLQEPLNCLNDCIEFTIKGTPTQNVNTLRLKMDSVNGPIFSYNLSDFFMANMPFEKTVKVPLEFNYDPKKETWVGLSYYTGPDWNNSKGLEIIDFSISARGIKNEGFLIPKHSWSPDFTSTYEYSHGLNSSAVMQETQTDTYLNIDLAYENTTPQNVYNLYLNVSLNGTGRRYRICEIYEMGARFAEHISIDCTDIPKNNDTNFIDLLYYKEDEDSPITLKDFSFSADFSSSPRYDLIDGHFYKNPISKKFPKDSYSLENNTLTIKDSRALENITENINFWEGTGISRDEVHSIIISEGITEIPANSFHGLTKTYNITLPSTLTYIGHSAFLNQHCDLITIPSSVTFINNHAFAPYICPGQKIILDWPHDDSTYRNISDSAFRSQGGGYAEVYYNDGVQYIY